MLMSLSIYSLRREKIIKTYIIPKELYAGTFQKVIRITERYGIISSKRVWRILDLYLFLIDLAVTYLI